VTDENLKQDTLLYDALDRLDEIRQLRPDPQNQFVTDFAYDSLSSVSEVTDPASKSTDYVTDDAGRLVKVVSPDTGTTLYLRDPAGNLVSKVEAAGTTSARTTTYTYDGLDRLTEIDFPNDPDWTLSYDTDASKNQKGRLEKVTNGAVTTAFEYTDRGQVAVERTTVDATVYTVAYAYDASGSRTGVTLPSGAAITTDYRGARPLQVEIGKGSQSRRITGLAWLPFGPRTGAWLPPENGAGINTVTTTRAYNLRGQVEEIDVVSAAGTVVDRSYRYANTAAPGPNDPGPNLDQLTDHLDAAQSRYFWYDDLDRLWKTTETTGSPPLAIFTYLYDAAGNRTSEASPAGTIGYHYEGEGAPPGDETDRIDASDGARVLDYTHDACGNRIYAGAAAYTGTASHVFDQSNRLVEVKDPAAGFALLGTYTYDAFGRRIQKVAGGKTTHYFYDLEGQLLEQIEKQGVTDLVRSYVFVEGELLGVWDRATSAIGTPAWLQAVWLRVSGDVPPPPLWLVALAGTGALLGGVLASRRRLAPAAATAATSAAVLLTIGSCGGTAGFYWIHTDHLGTPLAVTNTPSSSQTAQTKVVWKATYEPFGLATPNPDPDGDGKTFTLDVRFPGQLFDAESGLHDNYFRTYDPTVGRYLERDPIGQSGGINTFVYVGNDPIGFIDPSGRAIPAVIAACAANPACAALAVATGGALANAVLGTLNALEAENGGDESATANCSPRRNKPDQEAAIELAKEAKNKGGLAADEAEALVELGNSVGVPSRGPEAHPNRPQGKSPHIHVGPVGHIPVR
jgi:RHS repeat-associated protein